MRRVVLLSALLVLSVPVLPAGASSRPDDLAACRVKGGDVDVRRDGWTRIGPPRYDADEGPEGLISAWTTSPTDPNRVYASNGEVVKRSTNGGCDWETLWSGSNNVVPTVDNNPDVVTHLVAPTKSALWLATYDDNKGVPRPHVYNGYNMGLGDSGAPGFNPIDTGLPAYGVPVDLDVARSDLDSASAYLLVDELPDPAGGDSAMPARRLYTTTSHDVPPSPAPPTQTVAVWQEREMPAGFGALKGLTAGMSGHTVWAWSDTKYAVMHDANEDGATWTVADAPGPIRTIDVNAFGDVHVAGADGPVGYVLTVDERNTVTDRSLLPVAPASFAHGQDRAVFVVSGKGGTFGWDRAEETWVDISPDGVAPFGTLAMANGAVNVYVLGQAGNALYRWDTYPVEMFRPVRKPLGGFGDVPDLWRSQSLLPPTLTPRRQVVTVEPGKQARVPVEFQAGPYVTPLNVYFLVDTTSSMAAAINGLAHDLNGIADGLTKRLGVNACFGVGEIRDGIAGSVTVGDSTDVNGKSYRAVQKIDCLPNNLARTKQAIGALKSSSGGDKPEAQTLALQQSVKGDRWLRPPVDSGQDAGWGALPPCLPPCDPRTRVNQPFKVVVLVTDAPFHEGSENYGLYPTIAEAARTLTGESIKVVNVVVGGSNGVDPEAVVDLQEIARLTGTLAPDDGVDCDGDGNVDLSRHDPLVCASTGDGNELAMGPAVIGLLLAVPDPGTLAVDVRDDGRAVREPVEGPTSAVGDLKRRNVLAFALPLSCTRAQDGADLLVGLRPTLRGYVLEGKDQEILDGTIVVRCRAVPLPPPVPDPPEQVLDRPRLRVIVVAPPPPPPAPVQPVSNINPNAGFSQQEEEQLQVAAVGQDAAHEEDELEGIEAMETSALDPDSPAAAAFVFGGAAILGSAAALAYRRRLQRSPRTSYVG